MKFDDWDETELGARMAADHRAFVNRCLAAGHLLPWMDIDTVLDRDERALLSRIAEHGPVAWGVFWGVDNEEHMREDLALKLGYESVGNLKATVNKCRNRDLTDHFISGSVEWIDMSDMGDWLHKIVEADDGSE